MMLSDTNEKIKEVKIDPKTNLEVPFVSSGYMFNRHRFRLRKKNTRSSLSEETW